MEIKTHKSELEREFLQFLTQDVGKGQFFEDKYEEVEAEEGKEEEQEDFGFEEEQGDEPQTQLYKKSIILAPQKRTPINKAPPQLYIHNYNFLYGCNHGSRTVTMVQGKICVGVGVNVFYAGKVYCCHNHTITFLSYQTEHKILITGTQGKCAQIMLWSCVQGENGHVLEPYFQEQQNNMLNLPLSCLAVGSACLIRQETLVVVTKFNLHKNSVVYIFDLKTRKRVLSQVKLDKVIEIINGSPVVLLTAQGLVQLEVNQGLECQIKKIGFEMTITSVSLFENKESYYLLGSLDGSIHLTDRESKKICNSVELHEKYVICIRSLKEEVHASVGGDKQLILFKITQDKVIHKLQTLFLQNIALNILPVYQQENVFHCVLKTGQIVEVLLNEDEKTKINDKGNDWDMVYQTVSRADVTQHFIYNKYANKYFYGFSDSPQLSILSIDQTSKITSVKKVILKYEPFLLDIVGNIAAYLQRDTKFGSTSTVQSSLFKSKQKPQAKNLILQDYTSQKIYGQMQLLQDCCCTKLKLNPDGSKLGLGFQNGKIAVFDINKPSNITLLKESTVHESAVVDIIWSSDSKYLKTISKDNLVYFQVQNQGDHLKAIYTSKFLKDVEWTGVGKFDWRTNYVYEDHMHTPSDISNIKDSKSYLLACLENGDLKIYRNPASKTAQKLTRMFSNSFECYIINDNDTYFTAVFTSNGIIFALQISDEEPTDAQH